MNAKETRKYEMLLRVRDFGNTHRALFSDSSVAQRTFAAIGAAIDELATLDVSKATASILGRADAKRAARRALAELLLDVRRLARLLRAGGVDAALPVRSQSRSDQALLAAGRQSARDAESFDAEFTSYGLAPSRIAQVASAFETAMRDRGINRADLIATQMRVQELLRGALRDVQRLDLIINNWPVGDPVIEAVWKQARRIDDPRRRRWRERDESCGDSRAADSAEHNDQLVQPSPG